MSISDWTMDEGESGTISAIVQDKDDVAIPGSSLSTLTIRITDALTGTVINGRDNQSILNENNGTVDESGILEFKVQPEDSINVGSPKGVLEVHQIELDWTWNDIDAELQTGTHVFLLYTYTSSDQSGASDLALPTPTTDQFTSLSEIQRVFSVEGVDNHTEDFLADTTVINEIVYRATETVLQFLRGRYAVADMANSYWIRMKATYIACYYLSIRQGNPALYGDMYNEAMLDLAQARDGIINPGLKTELRAIVQTPMLDSRFYHPARINPQRSTKIYSGQRMPYRLGTFD
jgi:hypothetical protein